MAAMVHIFSIFSLLVLGESLSFRRLFNAASLREVNNTAVANERQGECTLAGVPFYILNLDRRRADKFVAMEGVIERDMPWMCSKTCRVSAPDGQSWGARVNSKIMGDKDWQTVRANKHETYPKLTPGAVALMAGHARIWEHIVQEKAPFAVVMEDDLARFHPQTAKLLCWITQVTSMQSGWDFIMMQDGWNPADPYKPLIMHSKGHVFNTGMYIIKLEGARKALQAMFPVTKLVQLDHTDSPLWSKLRGGHTDPSAADASHDITDVQSNQFFNASASLGSGCAIPDCKPLKRSSMIVPELTDPTKD